MRTTVLAATRAGWRILKTRENSRDVNVGRVSRVFRLSRATANETRMFLQNARSRLLRSNCDKTVISRKESSRRWRRSLRERDGKEIPRPEGGGELVVSCLVRKFSSRSQRADLFCGAREFSRETRSSFRSTTTTRNPAVFAGEVTFVVEFPAAAMIRGACLRHHVNAFVSHTKLEYAHSLPENDFRAALPMRIARARAGGRILLLHR